MILVDTFAGRGEIIAPLVLLSTRYFPLSAEQKRKRQYERKTSTIADYD